MANIDDGELRLQLGGMIMDYFDGDFDDDPVAEDQLNVGQVVSLMMRDDVDLGEVASKCDQRTWREARMTYKDLTTGRKAQAEAKRRARPDGLTYAQFLTELSRFQRLVQDLALRHIKDEDAVLDVMEEARVSYNAQLEERYPDIAKAVEEDA